MTLSGAGVKSMTGMPGLNCIGYLKTCVHINTAQMSSGTVFQIGSLDVEAGTWILRLDVTFSSTITGKKL